MPGDACRNMDGRLHLARQRSGETEGQAGVWAQQRLLCGSRKKAGSAGQGASVGGRGSEGFLCFQWNRKSVVTLAGLGV